MLVGDGLKPNNTPIVRVEWNDYTMIDSWNDEEEVDYSTLSSVGWLLEDSGRRQVIAMTYDYSAGRWAKFLVLPKAPPEIMVVARPNEIPVQKVAPKQRGKKTRG